MNNMQNDQIVIYKTENSETVIDVKIDSNTIWLTLNQISDLFGKNKSTISRHLNNIMKKKN
ncbi:ArsR family transcriptional regulator [Pedobacter sp. L105]|uniref:ArsR family transcriptional regulator n=1 Tax=Pedobacter sp. L105 TaxID=1641871 RepID=UPI00352BBB3B